MLLRIDYTDWLIVSNHSHEGGWLAAVDEWHHRNIRSPFLAALFRPLCNLRDRRIDWADPLTTDDQLRADLRAEWPALDTIDQLAE